ncbi:MAG TPA: nuclear transport factor 2 family protein [Pyrinomonadaceae bacterium]|nr:nuclear transport factor 2 family protein [Pyrinomonadaceae bacterium]
MKKFLVLVSAIILTVACAAPPTNREAAPTNANRAADTTLAPLTEADAIAKEKAVWDALKAKNWDTFGSMLATDYLEISSDGVFDKPGIIARLKELEFTDATFADWKLLPLGKDEGLLMYNLTLKGKYKGQDFPPGPYRVGSVWANRAGKWQAVFYQETLGAPAEPHPAGHAPTPAASPSAASPAKASDIPNVADPIAREKAVYDSLKRKDYDAFAAMLDEAQIEAWPDGFHDKAASLAGVRMFDATKAELSEFKTVKVGPESELVTYLVTMSGEKPEKVRASTIWIKRGEKWLAIYHQGTEVDAPAASPSPAK